MTRNALGAVAVGIGAWEAAAFVNLAPPVSAAYAGARRRWRRRAEVGLALWLVWVAVHLLSYESES